MADGQIDERKLDRFLNDLTEGRMTGENYDLPADVQSVVRAMRVLGQSPLPPPSHDHVESDVRAEMARFASAHERNAPVGQSTILSVDQTRFAANGHAGSLHGARSRVRTSAVGRRRWAVAHLATAAMLAVTLGSVYLAFLHPRSGGVQPTAVPPFASTLSGSLLDVVADSLPSPNTALAVTRWQFRPGTASLTLVASDGARYVVADTGSVAVAFDGEAHVLATDEHVDIPGGPEVELRNAGTGDATAFVVYVMPNNEATWWDWSADPTQITRALPVLSNTDAFPTGPVRLRLERLMLSPGEILPAYETTGLEWIGILSGRLGLTLAGEEIPFGWKPGQEQQFVGEPALPVLPTGLQITLRNAGDDSLALVRLSVEAGGVPETPMPASSPAATN